LLCLEAKIMNVGLFRAAPTNLVGQRATTDHDGGARQDSA
jgi:hypothetical protein